MLKNKNLLILAALVVIVGIVIAGALILRGGDQRVADAGREVRVMVKPEQVSEDQMVIMARDLAKKIENEMEYPGQIKVHVLRETKVVEYAK